MDYWEIKNDVSRLKREQKYKEALNVLTKCIEYTEEQAHLRSRPLYPWPYEQTAIVLRKLKRIDVEVQILERYFRLTFPYNKQGVKLADRYATAAVLAGLAEEREINGSVQLIHLNDGVPLQNQNVFQKRGLIVDVETTGLSNHDELIEIGAILFQYSQLTGEMFGVEETYTGLRQPSIKIPPDATAIHGLSWKDVKGKRLDDKRMRKLVSSADIIIAHNASFDRRFIAKLYPKVDTKPWYCSMNGIAWKQRGHRSKALQKLLRDYGLQSGNAHRGLDDTNGVLQLLKQKDSDAGQSSLVELLMTGPTAAKRTDSMGSKPRRKSNPKKANFSRFFGKRK